MPNSSHSFLATVEAATRAVVSLALDLSSTFRKSWWPYFNAPGKSACPGTTRVCTLRSTSLPTGPVDIASVQLTKSRFSIHIEIGEPSVTPCRTPPRISALSFSIFMRPPLPYPRWRRARCAAM